MEISPNLTIAENFEPYRVGEQPISIARRAKSLVQGTKKKVAGVKGRAADSGGRGGGGGGAGVGVGTGSGGGGGDDGESTPVDDVEAVASELKLRMIRLRTESRRKVTFRFGISSIAHS